MKICILDDAYEDSQSPMKAHDLDADVEVYLTEHEVEKHPLKKATAVKKIQELVRKGFDVFINLCDGAWDEDRPGIEVVMTLDRLGAAYTGADFNFYDPSRELMKIVCHYWDVRTPGYAFIYHPENIESTVANLNFPLIVKHPNSYSSLGLTKQSRVQHMVDLTREVIKMIDTYDGALVEEFIDGREFTVLVAENPDDPQRPIAYPPVEFVFPEGESFKHFDMKWVTYQGMSCVPCTDADVSLRLQDMSQRLFLGLQGVGYGRCDLRMDRSGELYMLEINPNCGIFYPLENAGSADFILMNTPGGHRAFVDNMLRAAIQRRERKRRSWKLILDSQFQYGMYAIRHLEPGEIIEPFEEQPHVLVSKAHVNNHWNVQQKEWFARYAYPITDETWVMWHPRAEEWKPINHSCDPNAWLDGLNLVARRPIAPGEQITVEYATFCGDDMQPFACTCGTSACRGTIRGDDYKLPVMVMYAGHVSDYVRNKGISPQPDEP